LRPAPHGREEEEREEVLLLKTSRKEQRSFSVGKRKLVQTPFSLRGTQCVATTVLRDQQYIFGAKSLLVVEKSKKCC